MRIVNILADGTETEIRGRVIRQTEHPETYRIIGRIQEERREKDGGTHGDLPRP